MKIGILYIKLSNFKEDTIFFLKISVFLLNFNFKVINYSRLETWDLPYGILFKNIKNNLGNNRAERIFRVLWFFCPNQLKIKTKNKKQKSKFLLP